MTRILIVEDEEHLAAGLTFNLEVEGYAVEVVDTGEAAVDAVTVDSGSRFDLVLLDIMLPGIDGFEVVRRLRAAGAFVPVLILTARGQTDDVLRGFELGADDYLTKPFDLSILLARVQGLLRRQAWHGGSDVDARATGALDEYRFGTCRIDFAHQLLERGGVPQRLTVMETTLLRYLVRHEGLAVSRKALLEDVWGVRKDTDTRTIDNFMARLRRYVEDEPSKPRHLETVRGIGYRFVADPSADAPAT